VPFLHPYCLLFYVRHVYGDAKNTDLQYTTFYAASKIFLLPRKARAAAEKYICLPAFIGVFYRAFYRSLYRYNNDSLYFLAGIKRRLFKLEKYTLFAEEFL
jgi:hypothetical protein